MEHTKLPWHLSKIGNVHGINDEVIASMGYLGIPFEESKENMKIIVESVNSYKKLKNSVKRLIFAIEKLEGKDERDTLTYQIIKEALEVIKQGGLK